MAMIDYGAVVFKNGKQINHDMFMDMKESVGWEDHPKNRYHDCDCLTSDGYSDCGECSRSQKNHYSDPELGEWDSVVADCRGNKILIDGKLSGNYFAYVGDNVLTFCFYKYSCVAVADGKIKGRFWGAEQYTRGRGRMVYRGEIKGTSFCIRLLSWSVCHFSMVYKGDVYHVVYGYGIDANTRIWNNTKVQYLGKKVSRKVDNLYKRITRGGK